MEFKIMQKVTVEDMSGELIEEVFFDHGTHKLQTIHTGYHVETKKLGLKDFAVVYDNRTDETLHSKVVDVEISLVHPEKVATVFLEPITLILGQHDVGMV